MRTASLRQRLLLLAAAGVLPLAVLSGLALSVLYTQNRAQAERTGLDVARAISAAVDAELQRIESVLKTLGTSARLDDGALEAFAERARRAHADEPLWRAIRLHHPAGRALVDTGGVADPDNAAAEGESFQEAVKSGRPVVGYLHPGPRGVFAVPVRVPVVREGRVRYVLTAMVDPGHFLRLLERTRIPGEWLVALSDARGLRVARTRSTEQSIGTPFSPTLVEMIARGGDEGHGVTDNSEGEPVFTAYHRSTESRWITAVGLPVGIVEENARESFLAFASGIVLSIVLGALAALYIARSIAAPMAQLREAALRAGRSGPLSAPDTDIREIRDVAQALATAEHERARAEAEREELLRSETRARASAEAANRAKDEFLAMLGHELRNPIGAISNASTLLESPGLDARAQDEARAVIRRQAAHLARLTDDLLDAGRALQGKIALRREPVDLAAVAAHALATLESSGRLARHRVATMLCPAWAEADPIRLDQIVVNLVTNAVKYTPPGGEVRIEVRREGSEALLRVSDSGIGIPPALGDRIFDLFVQGDRDLDRALGGLGIGLTLVRRLAELHGGAVEARSEGEDRGSEFTVRLPAIEAPPQAASVPEAAAPATGRDILIIEDNSDARETLAALLELLGHRVRTARDGVEGVAAALAHRPEVLLVDVGLPRMDGYAVARTVRAADGWERRPLLVAITGYGLPEDRERARSAGFDAHLTKPVEIGTLAAIMSGREASP